MSSSTTRLLPAHGQGLGRAPRQERVAVHLHLEHLGLRREPARRRRRERAPGHAGRSHRRDDGASSRTTAASRSCASGRAGRVRRSRRDRAPASSSGPAIRRTDSPTGRFASRAAARCSRPVRRRSAAVDRCPRPCRVARDPGRARTAGPTTRSGPRHRALGDVLQACVDAAPGATSFGFRPTGSSRAAWAARRVPHLGPPTGKFAGFHRWKNDRARATGLTFRPIADTVKAILAWYPGEVERRMRVARELAGQAAPHPGRSRSASRRSEPRARAGAPREVAGPQRR